VYVLSDVAILMVVPLDMNGESVTMSRQGGKWDAMKRTLVWKIAQLAPGETLDIQAQFQCLPEPPIEGVGYQDDMGISAPGSGGTSSFPVLARCNGNGTFSKIDLNTDFSIEDGTSIPVELEIERLATVLYRKAP
jgi:hypothetical protein